MSFVDWAAAGKVAHRLIQDGPDVSLGEAHAAVEDLRDAAQRARGPVAETARMHSPSSADSPVLIVDRTVWTDINLASTSALLDPVIEQVFAKKQPGPVSRAVSAKVGAAEVGAVFGFVAGKVLGQFDIAPGGTPSLLLVAPNIVATERELAVDPTDFRLWVCLHEETHRVQLTGVPWLREHMIERTRELMLDLVPDPDQLGDRLQQALRALPGMLREGGGGLADLVTTPQQREKMADLTAVMSLLEGHADVIMDDVGPQVVPTVAEIRRKFTARRGGSGGVDRLLRRLLGLDAKMRQYRDGAVFVRAVVDAVGIDGFNQVWTSPQTLPTAREIENPAAWVARVHP
ncbi:zinc-dependent metalloprotease [Branchiibius cervicis]|uniref:Zinc-dependent metalloprotease n=1 Tax=Branchiibius cervicis TaxID=908252 RepID=A0ABW2ANR4_9MICO